MNWRMQRIRVEAAMAAAGFSVSRRADIDADAGSWVIIRDVPLPLGYNRASTDILFLLPASYPAVPPDWFYLDPGLRGPRGPLRHYFEAQAGHAPVRKGWAAGSLHIRGWAPSSDPMRGHSLMHLCQLAKEAFARWAQ
ncbi:MAG TPA: E2/UBC family protein [Armatimonadota bacterium]|jgi:hypothetical protein